ncbi:hypothetical protein, partial [Chromobacterium amazonense]|uniref:hypothetical protein n=1 Tax=Chromobacterium amazonense TaxID=1382803 RepID=UPI003F7A698F
TGTPTLDKFFSYFDLQNHEYKIFFFLADTPATTKDYLPKSMYDFYENGTVEYNNLIESLPRKSKIFLKDTEMSSVIVRKDIKALDPQSARAKAERDLLWLTELIQAKQHKFKLNLKNESIVYRTEKNEFINSNRP